MTLMVKKFFLMSKWAWGLYNFNSWPLSPVLDIVKKSVGLTSSKPLKILNTSIKSPRNLLVSSVIRPKRVSLSPYVRPLSLIISLVARFCTFFNKSISYLRYGLQACTQYSNFGLTNVWYNLNIPYLSLFTNVRLIIPRVLLADFAAAAHWLLDFSARVTTIPRSFSSSSTLTISPPSL